MTPTLLLLAAAVGWQVPSGSFRSAGSPDGAVGDTGRIALSPVADSATLVVHGTPIVVFRSRLGPASPAERVAAATRRIDALISEGGEDSLSVAPGPDGVMVEAGDRALFLITSGDADASRGETPAHLATRAVVTLRGATTVASHERSLGFLLRAAGLAVLATLLFLLACRLLLKATRAVLVRVPEIARRLPALTVRGFSLLAPRQVSRVVRRALIVGAWTLGAVLAYLWLTYVLTRFPVSRQWGEALGGFLLATIRRLAFGAADAVPGLVTVLIILVVARWLARLVAAFFAAIEAGRVEVPWVHAETAQPTRRIALALLWVFAIVVAYPYLPGSGSDVFKGVSVFLGVMLSLGSTGLVNQAMSGLVLMYARSFRPGDYVRIGEIEGVVTSLALLSTKIRTTKNEEVTIPNAALVAGGSKNYTRLADDPGVILYTTVTIGYDAPWRQVHALLALAASRTEGLRKDPPPFVLQTALSDFYVEYQLNARLERPETRILVLSALHAHILDAFNEYGVQIMSPHFERQPRETVVVPAERWYAAPAQPASRPTADPARPPE